MINNETHLLHSVLCYEDDGDAIQTNMKSIFQTDSGKELMELCLKEETK